MEKSNRKYNLVEYECKMLKSDIIGMISTIGLDDIGVLQGIKSAIINAQADYYYSILVADSYIKDFDIKKEEA